MELSEEEKKAIDRLEDLISKSKVIADIDINKQVAFKDITIILNLTKKRQEEIYRLQNIKRKDIQDLINNEKENIYENYISKDKIRELREIDNIDLIQFKIKELLEEN